MKCFDCGKKRLKGISVLKQADGTIEKVCWGCWNENWAKWMPETREKFQQRLIKFRK